AAFQVRPRVSAAGARHGGVPLGARRRAVPDHGGTAIRGRARVVAVAGEALRIPLRVCGAQGTYPAGRACSRRAAAGTEAAHGAGGRAVPDPGRTAIRGRARVVAVAGAALRIPLRVCVSQGTYRSGRACSRRAAAGTEYAYGAVGARLDLARFDGRGRDTGQR